ncbi:MAG: AAA family ATPase, partial [Chitinispirillia bacterium]|nr:AAA family ATPase [Chitinispirillia bacterium]MCL2268010.1 AAA family ATPase [Chitinispirillia bacterium]
MKELPTGLQEFEHIRRADALYVDKTAMIHKLVSGARKQFFLSRPRRFGKTLTCWTLDALFSGKRELFEGLAISKTDWAWESFPVIHLDMSMVRTSDGVGGVKESLAIQTMEVAGKHGIAVDQNMAPGDMLRKIIIGAAEKHGKPAVVIVDEYDKPFLDFYNQPPMAGDVRKVMRDYYIQLKANESNIRFLFMTGISKFTKAGVFSTLNNLNDLS